MDRLKDPFSDDITQYQGDLHSNMDRLKVVPNIRSYVVDLYLHSNMDRLKEFEILISFVNIFIYIPIWID